jgi:hypothetical protein
VNGNQTGWTDDKTGQRRDIMWDVCPSVVQRRRDENRIRSISDNGSQHHYIYDASGERVIKGKSTGQRIFVKLLAFLSSILLLSCNGAQEEKFIGNYYLKYTDIKSGMGIYYLDGEYFIGVINPTVFVACQNDAFIIVKQHPENLSQIDKSITNYFIIPIKDKLSQSAEKNVIGPLSKVEFETKCRELGVTKDLKFTKVFKDLE